MSVEDINFLATMQTRLCDEADEAMADCFDALEIDIHEKASVDDLSNLAIKLGKLTAEVANHSVALRTTRLGEYVMASFTWGLLRHTDFEHDFAIFKEQNEDDDYDNDEEDIHELIDRVLEDLRNL